MCVLLPPSLSALIGSRFTTQTFVLSPIKEGTNTNPARHASAHLKIILT
jgi:hypothetical protein